MTKKEIGRVLKAARVQSGLTQAQVAAKLGKRQQVVGNWETGYAQPDTNTFFTLCAIYGISIDEAFGNKRKPSITTSLDAIIQRSGGSDAVKAFVTIYSQLTPQNQKALTAVLDQVSALMAQGKSSNPDDLLEQAKGAVIQSEENKKAWNE